MSQSITTSQNKTNARKPGGRVSPSRYRIFKIESKLHLIDLDSSDPIEESKSQGYEIIIKHKRTFCEVVLQPNCLITIIAAVRLLDCIPHRS